MPGPHTPIPGIGATDPALPDGPATNLAHDRELLNNRRYLRGATWGLLVWSGRFEVSGTAAAPVVTLGAIESCVLRRASGAVRAYYALRGATLGAAHLEGGGSLTAEDWYYVYAINAGTDEASTMTFEISATPPGASGVFKNDGLTELSRYLGCFPTNTAGHPVPLYCTRGRAIYRRSAIVGVGASLGSDGLGAVVGGGAIARTDLDLSSRIPPHARMALLQGHIALLAGAGTGFGALNLYSAADTSSIAVAIAARAEGLGAKAENSAAAEIELTSAQVCSYSVTQTLATAVGDLDVLGWQE